MCACACVRVCVFVECGFFYACIYVYTYICPHTRTPRDPKQVPDGRPASASGSPSGCHPKPRIRREMFTLHEGEEDADGRSEGLNVKPVEHDG